MEEREFSTGFARGEAAGEEERFVAKKTREAGKREKLETRRQMGTVASGE